MKMKGFAFTRWRSTRMTLASVNAIHVVPYFFLPRRDSRHLVATKRACKSSPTYLATFVPVDLGANPCCRLGASCLFAYRQTAPRQFWLTATSSFGHHEHDPWLHGRLLTRLHISTASTSSLSDLPVRRTESPFLVPIGFRPCICHHGKQGDQVGVDVKHVGRGLTP
jgi:hypothetical protein